MHEEEMTSQDKTKKDMKILLFEGIFNSIKSGLAESFIVPMSVFLKATDFQFGMLSSLPLAISSGTQLFAQRINYILKTRKTVSFYSAVLQALSLILLILFFIFGWLTVPLMIFFTVLFYVFEKISLPAWNSLMGDIVPEHIRGIYFGKRNKLNNISNFFAIIMGGAIIGLFGVDQKSKALAFTIIFLLAAIFRIFSALSINKMFEPYFDAPPKPSFSFFDFIKTNAWETNFGAFVMYQMAMNIAIYVSIPFIGAYLMNELGWTYWQYTIFLGVNVITKFVCFPLWGKAADRYGNRKIMVLSGFLIPLWPILFLISKNYWWILGTQVFSGFAWAGFDLVSFNYIFDSTSSVKRPTCIMYHNFLNGIGILIGSIAGTFLVRMPIILWSKYLLAFLISGILRFLATILFVGHIDEVRKVKNIRYEELFFDVLPIRPTVNTVVKTIVDSEKSIENMMVKGAKRFRIKP